MSLFNSEEFAIYLNYVRKLGFEENPDYDFLRDLLTKVLRNSGEVEDGVYDWMLLNGGKGWQASTVSAVHRRLKAICSYLLLSLVIQCRSGCSVATARDTRPTTAPFVSTAPHSTRTSLQPISGTRPRLLQKKDASGSCRSRGCFCTCNDRFRSSSRKRASAFTTRERPQPV